MWELSLGFTDTRITTISVGNIYTLHLGMNAKLNLSEWVSEINSVTASFSLIWHHHHYHHVLYKYFDFPFIDPSLCRTKCLLLFAVDRTRVFFTTRCDDGLKPMYNAGREIGGSDLLWVTDWIQQLALLTHSTIMRVKFSHYPGT